MGAANAANDGSHPFISRGVRVTAEGVDVPDGRAPSCDGRGLGPMSRFGRQIGCNGLRRGRKHRYAALLAPRPKKLKVAPIGLAGGWSLFGVCNVTARFVLLIAIYPRFYIKQMKLV